MSETTDLETLLRLMPPVTPSDTQVDWDRLAATWGRQFPPTYRRFIEVYGAGTVQDYLVIVGPEAEDGMRADTEQAAELWREARRSPGLTGAEPRLITWGVDSSGDHLCWDASDQDPEKWPVLLYSRGDDMWWRHDVGMVGFLVRILRGDFPHNPLGDVRLFGIQEATYLTRSEYTRRLREGTDPWTGEPDEFAGMFDY